MADAIEQRALAAIIRHEKARQAVDALSRRIGASIQRCPIIVKSNDWTISNHERAEIWDDVNHHHKTHLWMAYNSKAVYGEHFDDEGQQDALHPSNGGCRHCLRAFRLIRQRKALRKELGHAKLSIRALGRSALMIGEDAGRFGNQSESCPHCVRTSRRQVARDRRTTCGLVSV
jgi:hypothetical protein